MNGNYLIPANTKRGRLILGLFTPLDLIIFASGISVTLLLVVILPMNKTWAAITSLVPGVVCSLLVAPVAYYHNVRQLIIEIYEYFSKRSRYVWKGWCFLDESEDKSK